MLEKLLSIGISSKGVVELYFSDSKNEYVIAIRKPLDIKSEIPNYITLATLSFNKDNILNLLDIIRDSILSHDKNKE